MVVLVEMRKSSAKTAMMLILLFSGGKGWEKPPVAWKLVRLVVLNQLLLIAVDKHLYRTVDLGKAVVAINLVLYKFMATMALLIAG